MESEEEQYPTPNVNRYLEKLGLTVVDLRGKRILDIGAGGLYFAKEAWLTHGLKVFSVEPDLSEPLSEYFRLLSYVTAVGTRSPLLKTFKMVLGRSVVAVGQSLPFQDKSFDLVISVFGVPWMLEYYCDAVFALLESLRVLKSDGTLVLYPLEFRILTKKDDTALRIEVLQLQKFCELSANIIPYPDPEAMRIYDRLIIKKGPH